MEEVARKFAALGVDEPTTPPVALVVRMAEGEMPERVREEVAVMAPPTKREPEMSASPWTERSFEGEVVPIPTFPPAVASNTVPVAVKVLPKKPVPLV